MKLGPYELNTIVCGECADLMEQLPDGCIDLTVTSPPYDNLRTYNGYVFPFERIARQLYRVTKPGGVVVWVVADATIDGSETGTSFRQALYFRDACGFRLHDTMIWQRKTKPLTHNRYEMEFEYVFILSKGRPSSFNPILVSCDTAGNKSQLGAHRNTNGNRDYRWSNETTLEYRIRGNVWYIPIDNKTAIKFDHPAIFPEALAHDHIISWSNPGDIVLDPMAGSGTTCKMAVITGRQYLGFDISEEYCNLARWRVGEVEREQRKEWRQVNGKGKLDDLPLFAGLTP